MNGQEPQAAPRWGRFIVLRIHATKIAVELNLAQPKGKTLRA
jgi:hypothetical protein